MANTVADKPSHPTRCSISKERDGRTRLDYYSSRTMKSYAIHTDMSPQQAAEFIKTLRTDALLTAFEKGIGKEITVFLPEDKTTAKKEKLKLAASKVSNQVISMLEVVMVGEGLDEVIIYLREAIPPALFEKLPKECDGFKVVQEVIGNIIAGPAEEEIRD